MNNNELMLPLKLLSIRHLCEAKPVALGESQYCLSHPVWRKCSRSADYLWACSGNPGLGGLGSNPTSSPHRAPHAFPSWCCFQGGIVAVCFLLHRVHGTVYTPGVNNHWVVSCTPTWVHEETWYNIQSYQWCYTSNWSAGGGNKRNTAMHRQQKQEGKGRLANRSL